jgi:hypothetical protein
MAGRMLQAKITLFAAILLCTSPAIYAMNESNFWSVIESVGSSDGDSGHAQRLLKKLEALGPKERADLRLHFERMLERSNEALLRDEVNHVIGFCSSDCFLYVRAWLVSRGRKAFERAIRDPSAIKEILPATARGSSQAVEFEEFLYAATVLNATKLPDAPRLEELLQQKKERKAAFDDGNSVVVPGIGRISVGSKVRHRELGEGTILAIIPGMVVRAVIRFQSGEGPYALMPDFFEPLE